MTSSEELSDSENQELLLRIHLGLSPIHCLLTAVRVIYDEGREQFEALRGEPCEHAYQWKPRRLRTPAPSLDRRR